jgi:trans-2,3-dihydro-3-hydroxyanthranilate isomerase
MSVPPSLSYEVVDVFTDRAFAGNPLAVVLDTDGMPTQALQRLAREFNLSETAFPQRSEDPAAGYRLRIFTPAVELPFAGHPSIGAAWVLARLGRIARGPVVQECGAGLLPLEVGSGAGADEVTLTGGAPATGDELDPAPLLAAVGLTAADLVGTPPRACGTGIDFAYLHVHADALARTRPDMALLERAGRAGVSVFALDGADVRARVFAGGVGVAEDPATGSAALGLGVFLAGAGLLPDGGDYVVQQGVEMGRPSVLRCRVTLGDTGALVATVSGSVVPVARGEITRPA